MLWVDAIHTNVERVRRYASLACGSLHMGDDLVQEALTPVLTDLSFAGRENRVALFRRVDAVLRQQPDGHADMFADFGRWQFLSPSERRAVLLVVLEGFSLEQAAHITDSDPLETKAAMKRAHMKYADRFPLRIGVLGGHRSDREQVARLLETARKFSVMWSVGADCPAGDATLPLPTAVLIVDEHAPQTVAGRADAWACVNRALARAGSARLDRAFSGPVVVAAPGLAAERLDSRLWTVPSDMLCHGRGLREMLVKALLFSD
jgi:hypothetical protein